LSSAAAALDPTPSPARRAGARLLQWLARCTRWLALAYPIVLLLLVLGLYLIGESWWVTGAALYVPRVVYLAPIPFLALGLVILRERRLLWTQAAALVIAVVPLMGLTFSVPSWFAKGTPRLKIVSLNANTGYFGYDNIAAALEALDADIILIQEYPWADKLSERLGKRYAHVEKANQFLIASRHPITKSTDPDRIPYYSKQRSPRFMRHLVETTLGPIALYNVHPVSPRGVMNVHEMRSAFHQLRTGKIFAVDPAESFQGNSGLRVLQIEAVGRMASQETVPVVMAGDFNLPGLSAVFRRHLSRYQDGFREAGSGFGYTFSAKYPLMRLDRILASDEFRFVSFRVGCPNISDHLCVIAELERD
jgi:endonuclease/exonuclease/phosphatase (EEP) superfamily protein YafD